MTRVVIVEPVSSGWSLIPRGHELGLEVIVLTHHRGERRVPDEYLRFASAVAVVDTNDDEAAEAAVRALHAAAPVAAVLPGFEYYVPLAARIGTALGLPSLDPDVALALRYKHRMRRALRAAGVAVPRFGIVDNEEELVAAVREVKLPCVVKPVDQSGSLYVTKAATAAEAQEAFRVIRDLSMTDLDRPSLGCVLVEEYVEGPEYSVEGFVEAGSMQVVNVTKKLLGPEPHFVEAGHIVPSELPGVVRMEAEAYVREVISALGLTMGPFHAELRLSARGPLLMEIAARLAGDRIPDLIRLALGIDLYEIMYCNYLGRPVNGAATPKRRASAGIRYFLRPDLKGYERFVGGERLETDPRIREIAVLVPPGSPVPPPTSHLGRLGYVIATAPSFEEVSLVLKEAERDVTFA